MQTESLVTSVQSACCTHERGSGPGLTPTWLSESRADRRATRESRAHARPAPSAHARAAHTHISHTLTRTHTHTHAHSHSAWPWPRSLSSRYRPQPSRRARWYGARVSSACVAFSAVKSAQWPAGVVSDDATVARRNVKCSRSGLLRETNRVN